MIKENLNVIREIREVLIGIVVEGGIC